MGHLAGDRHPRCVRACEGHHSAHLQHKPDLLPPHVRGHAAQPSLCTGDALLPACTCLLCPQVLRLSSSDAFHATQAAEIASWMVQGASQGGSSQLITQIPSSITSASEQRGAFPRPAAGAGEQGEPQHVLPLPRTQVMHAQCAGPRQQQADILVSAGDCAASDMPWHDHPYAAPKSMVCRL